MPPKEGKGKIVEDLARGFLDFIIHAYHGAQYLVSYFNLQLISRFILNFFAFMILLSGSISLVGVIYRRYKPQSTQELIMEAKARLKKEQNKMAVKTLKKCLALYPKEYEAYRILAEAQLYDGKYHECINTAKLGLSVDHTWKRLSDIIVEAESLKTGKLSKHQVLAGRFT